MKKNKNKIKKIAKFLNIGGVACFTILTKNKIDFFLECSNRHSHIDECSICPLGKKSQDVRIPNVLKTPNGFICNAHKYEKRIVKKITSMLYFCNYEIFK